MIATVATNPEAIASIPGEPRLWAAMVVASLGMFFTLVSAFGILRMPDLYTRMQAAAKAGTLGVALMVLSVAVYYNQLSYTMLALVIILFTFMTAPIASHLIGRAAYFIGVEKWSGHTRDDLAGCYDPSSHELRNDPAHDELKPNEDAGCTDEDEHQPQAAGTS
ncbi:MAG: monovalent cation/H(+) antiporter subunit G [Planctomycetota bacterium]